MTYRNRNNAAYLRSKGEHNFQASLTVPNESMELRELMERYARGLPLSRSHKQPLYHGEEELPDLQRMDLSEIHDLAESSQQRLKSYKDLQRLQQEQQLQAKEKKLLALQEELARYKEAQAQLTPNTPTTHNK